MSQITYLKGSLFEANQPGAILVHACNCKGSWGSGIAAQFKARHKEAFKDYEGWCRKLGDKLLGSATVTPSSHEAWVGCLYTSRGYGTALDPESVILKSTETAIRRLIEQIPEGTAVHMPKINSGLFRVPWHKTAEILERIGNETNTKFIVWEF